LIFGIGCKDLGRHLFYRATFGLPVLHAALHMNNAFGAHSFQSLSGERRAPTLIAVEYQSVYFVEFAPIVRAFGINPKFEHTSRYMKGTRNAPFSLNLAHIPQVDEQQAASRRIKRCSNLRRTQGIDFFLGFGN
jgi:hypothetical protein